MNSSYRKSYVQNNTNRTLQYKKHAVREVWKIVEQRTVHITKSISHTSKNAALLV